MSFLAGLLVGAFGGVALGFLLCLACVWNQLRRTYGDATVWVEEQKPEPYGIGIRDTEPLHRHFPAGILGGEKGNEDLSTLP